MHGFAHKEKEISHFGCEIFRTRTIFFYEEITKKISMPVMASLTTS